MKVLVLHFTKPSNSEANVLANLLANAPPDITFHVVLNNAGEDDEGSHFRRISTRPGISITSINVGLPIDPWEPAPRILKLLLRALHVVLRERVFLIARSLRPDVVYTSQQRFDCRVGELVSRRLSVPQVVHLHYTPGPWLRRRTLDRLRTCDRVIAISNYIARLAIEHGVDPGRVTVIPNTIELPEPVRSPAAASPPAHGRLTIGQVARMDSGKGFLDTVQVFARLHRQRREVRLLLVGDGPERAAVERTIRDEGLEDVVRLTGWQPRTAEWLERLDILIHPSRNEPFGLAVLEAMACGVPVVAYGECGVSEVVEDGVSGYLLPPGDLDGLLSALLRLTDDGPARAAFGKAARRRVSEKFDPADAGLAFADVLRQMDGHS